jgi:hypothetical protein
VALLTTAAAVCCGAGGDDVALLPFARGERGRAAGRASAADELVGRAALVSRGDNGGEEALLAFSCRSLSNGLLAGAAARLITLSKNIPSLLSVERKSP